MRVVSGTAGGRRIAAPPGVETRPTTDRVREAVFNALGSLGVVIDAEVVDLFAGSGALGIEALSRGAARATFVESDRRAADVVARNLADLGFADRGIVVRRPVTSALRELPDGIDLVLADPPYSFDEWVDLLEGVAPRLSDGAVVVAETDRSLDLPSGWAKVRERTYGGTVVVFARREPPDPGRPRPTGAPE